ncbi:hypothetical protein Fmac_026929 [Flemingia macrophylla]|uniref:Uncharacterized protein n=1 Tax=Flemingia macrophylla TaxID=520843 RepID=A0ABD1LHY0_9FABA
MPKKINEVHPLCRVPNQGFLGVVHCIYTVVMKGYTILDDSHPMKKNSMDHPNNKITWNLKNLLRKLSQADETVETSEQLETHIYWEIFLDISFSLMDDLHRALAGGS